MAKSKVAAQTIRFPAELKKALKAEAQTTGKDQQDIVIDALRAHLGRGKSEDEPRNEDELRAVRSALRLARERPNWIPWLEDGVEFVVTESLPDRPPQ